MGPNQYLQDVTSLDFELLSHYQDVNHVIGRAFGELCPFIQLG